MTAKQVFLNADIFWRKRGWISFLFALWALFALMIVHDAFYKNIFISPDSANYLREAQAIYHGYGMNCGGLSGDNEWFSVWPVGYPAMIAAFMRLMPGHSPYLASKMLSVTMVALMLLMFAASHREKSWTVAMVLLNPGLIHIYYYTWSEVPFLPMLIILSYGLSFMMRESRPKVWHYALVALGTIGAFSVRYFGIFALLYDMLLWGAMFMVYAFRDKFRNQDLRKKLLVLLAIGSAIALCEAAYLYMNRRMSGAATGVNRLYFGDDIGNLTANLFSALGTEAGNLLQQTGHPLFRYITPKPAILLSLLVAAGLITLLAKRHKVDRVFAFISLGIFYYADFIFVRYHSSMDGFSSRFFAPASILISIGLADCLVDYLGQKNVNVHAAMTGIFVLICLSDMSLLDTLSKRDYNAYNDFHYSIQTEFRGVPPRSMVLNTDWEVMQTDHGDYRWNWYVIRPDIKASDVRKDETARELIERASPYDYICIKKTTLRDKILSDDDYSESVKDFFNAAMTGSDGENQYVVIDMAQYRKQRKE